MKKWIRDDRATRDILLLISPEEYGANRSPTLRAIRNWTDKECQMAEHYAGKVHLCASDNPVRVPPIPEVLHRWAAGNRSVAWLEAHS